MDHLFDILGCQNRMTGGNAATTGFRAPAACDAGGAKKPGSTTSVIEIAFAENLPLQSRNVVLTAARFRNGGRSREPMAETVGFRVFINEIENRLLAFVSIDDLYRTSVR
jgi:hypothetical protein